MRALRSRFWRSPKAGDAALEAQGARPLQTSQAPGADPARDALPVAPVGSPGHRGPIFDSRLTRTIAAPQPPPDAQLLVRESRHGSRHTLALEGELALGSVELLEAAIARVFSQPATAVTLDLRGLSFLDSSGLWTITTLHKWCGREHVEFLVIPGPESIQQIFELTGLSDLIPFAPAADSEHGP
jgi:anti-sigma B factor antagonist